MSKVESFREEKSLRASTIFAALDWANMVQMAEGSEGTLLTAADIVKADQHRDGSISDFGENGIALESRRAPANELPPSSAVAKNFAASVFEAQKKITQTGRTMTGLIPEIGAYLLGDGYKVLLPSDLHKFEDQGDRSGWAAEQLTGDMAPDHVAPASPSAGEKYSKGLGGDGIPRSCHRYQWPAQHTGATGRLRTNRSHGGGSHAERTHCGLRRCHRGPAS